MMNYCAYVPHCLPAPHCWPTPMQEEPSYHPWGKRGRFAAERKAESVRRLYAMDHLAAAAADKRASTGPSDLFEMIATLANEQQAEAARREHIIKETRKDWNRNFGHNVIPDLMVGLTPAEAAKYPELVGRLT